MRTTRAGALTGLAALLVSASIGIAQPPTEKPCSVADLRRLEEAAKAEAARYGNPGSAGYTRALRDALQKSVIDLPAICAQGTTLSKRMAANSERMAANQPVSLVIDSDPRYQSWLERSRLQMTLAGELGSKGIGGNIPSSERTFDDVVALVSGEGPFCSGLLLSNRVVLTAAHCICNAPTQVRLGIYPDNPRWNPLEVHPVKRYLPAGLVCAEGSYRGRDMGLLLLLNPVPASLGVSWVKLASKTMVDQLAPSQETVVVGYGATEIGGWPGPMNFLNMPVISPNCSTVADQQTYGCVPLEELVSVDPRVYPPELSPDPLHPGPCHGDSGGGMFLKKRTGLHLVGIVSRLPDGSDVKCGDGAVFTLLTPARVAEIEKQRLILESN